MLRSYWQWTIKFSFEKNDGDLLTHDFIPKLFQNCNIFKNSTSLQTNLEFISSVHHVKHCPNTNKSSAASATEHQSQNQQSRGPKTTSRGQPAPVALGDLSITRWGPPSSTLVLDTSSTERFGHKTSKLLSPTHRRAHTSSSSIILWSAGRTMLALAFSPTHFLGGNFWVFIAKVS